LKTLFLVLIFSSLSLVVFQNCSNVGLDGSEIMTSQSLSAQATKVLETRCSSCHNPANAQGNVSNITDVSYLVYTTRLVVPGEPELSTVYVLSAQGQMPPGNPLSSGEIEILKNWITELRTSTIPAGPPPTLPEAISPLYSVIQSRILGPKCMVCHAAKNYKYDNYANVMRSVTATNSTNSRLYQSITTDTNPGGRMPRDGSLSPAEIQAIKTWIDNGAMNN
jgi:mono/diheme cytochrome c family protein